MLTLELQQNADAWLSAEGPKNHVAVSSRARYARNIADIRFAPHAPESDLGLSAGKIAEAMMALPELASWSRIAMTNLRPIERTFLRESRIISPEMEITTPNREVYVSADCRHSIMVNEEDHLRIQCILPGLQLREAFESLNAIEARLSEKLFFSFSTQLGYLTACPTNVGTGLRVSVMLHLPGLTLLRRMEELLQGIAPVGLTVRGFQGENSEFQGDFYQVSNEMTLGKDEDELLRILQRVVDQLIAREEQARAELLQKRRIVAEDVFWRSYAVLANARLINSQEAMRLLSRLRFGVDGGMIAHLTHPELNRLVTEIQPAHLRMRGGYSDEASLETRDSLRAGFLRERMAASPPLAVLRMDGAARE